MRRWMWTIVLGLTAGAAVVWAPRAIHRGDAPQHRPSTATHGGSVVDRPDHRDGSEPLPDRASPVGAQPSTPAHTPAQPVDVPETFWTDAVDCGMG